MKKISKPYKVPNRKGLYLSWCERGKRKRKQFNTLDEAKRFREKKYREVNRDVYDVDTFEDARDEFLERYDFKELSRDSKIQAKRTLRYFEEETNIINLSDLDQKAVNSFLKARRATNISKATINKEIRYLKAFVRWLVKKGYHNGRLEIDFVKTRPIIKKALTNEEIRRLLKVCPDKVWRMRILLSLVTGLRAYDIDNLQTSQINLKNALIDFTQSQKTGKVYYDRPLPSSLIPTLKDYLKGHKEENLLPIINLRKTWDAIRVKAKLPKTQRKDFRVTHSTLLQKIGSIDAAKHSLEHFSSRTTREHYTDWEIVMRWKIEQLNPIVKEWLK